MPSQLTALLITAAVITGAFVWMILSRKRSEARHFQDTVRNSWGKQNPRLFSVQEIGEIRRFYDRCDVFGASENAEQPDACGRIDDTTAADVDLDRVFGCIAAGALSSPGQEVLYAYLRHPGLKKGDVERRTALQDFFEGHPEERLEIQKILHQTGFLKQGSFTHCIEDIRQAEPVGRGRFLFLGTATAAALVLLLIRPLPALLLLIALLIADFRVHMSMKQSTLRPVSGFRAILRLLSASDAVIRADIPALSSETEELRRLSSAFRDFRKGSFFVTSGGSVGTGMDEAVLEYIKLLFHVDLIRFDHMLESVRAHESDSLRILELIGSLDAACACASFKASLPVFCRPVFADGEQQEAYYHAEDLVHPLLSHPVPNSIRTMRPVLLTGSNASGKSTFLKSVALSAILAQSIGIVTASSYEAPRFRIFSSMALADNLEGGESYFVVEIRSLKRIFDACEDPHPPVLAFVDEVLRGTNTTERIASSAQILKELAVPGALVFAATHDIELTGLLADSWRNMHFRETVKDGDVCFDYLLKEGRAESGNAIRLLAQSGYPARITDAAGKMAERFEETGEWKL